MNELMVHVTDKHRHGTKNPSKADIGVESKPKAPTNDKKVDKTNLSKNLPPKITTMFSAKGATHSSTKTNAMPSSKLHATTPSAKTASSKPTAPNNIPPTSQPVEKRRSEKPTNRNSDMIWDMKNGTPRSTRKRKERTNYEESSDENVDTKKNVDPKKDKKLMSIFLFPVRR